MRNPGGYLVIEDPDPMRSRGEQHIRECDTYTCNHCNGIVKVTPETNVCMCKKCMGFVCVGCIAQGGCTPFEEKLKVWEEKIARGIHRDVTLKSYGR